MSANGQAHFQVEAIERGLFGERFRGQLKHLRSVGSTNQVALEAAQAGTREGTWIADEQTAGRGRGGHTWHSAAGDGLYLSVLTVPAIALRDAFKLPLAAGLAVQRAVLETTGLACDVRWPNDLMFRDKKFGGILVESASEPLLEATSARLRYAVIGIGINVNHAGFPGELKSVATSLAIEAGAPFAREPLATGLLNALDRELNLMEKDAVSGQDILRRFAAASSWVTGKRVRVDEGEGYTGLTSGLDPRGFLLVKDDHGVVRTVLSGGVRSA